MSEEKKSRYTPAQKKAAEKYLKNKVEEVRLRVPKGEREEIREHAAQAGQSVNAYCVGAIREAMRRDDAAAGEGSGDQETGRS